MHTGSPGGATKSGQNFTHFMCVKEHSKVEERTIKAFFYLRQMNTPYDNLLYTC